MCHALVVKRDWENMSLVAHWLKTGSIEGCAQYVAKLCASAGLDVDIQAWDEEKPGMKSHLQLDRALTVLFSS